MSKNGGRRPTAKREKHFDRKQRERSERSKRIAKSESGREPWTSIEDRRALKHRDDE